MTNTISILGCGWLGFPLAKRLIASGWKVKGSTTNIDKLALLAENGIDPYLVHLGTDSLNHDHAVFESDVLLINVPPGLRKQTGFNYLAAMAGLAQTVKASPLKNVVFISSTSVYADLNADIVETDGADATSIQFKGEQLFAHPEKYQTSIIRFAGLIGPDRHPARFFAGKNNIPNGLAPVNLIHLADCLGVIEAVLNQQKYGIVIHAAAPSHPTKAEFYTLAAQNAGLPLPHFINELIDWKIIDPRNMVAQLNYTFIHPDLLQCLATFV